MITSVLSIILSFSFIHTPTGAQEVKPEIARADSASYAYESTLSLQPTFTSTFDYYTQVQLPLLKQQEEEKRQKELVIQIEAEKAREEEKIRIEQERIRKENEELQKKLKEQAQREEEARIRQQKVLEEAAKTSSQKVEINQNIDYISLIKERCATLGCDSDQIVRVMYCESGGRHNAFNKSSGASGLFQQMPQYWNARAAAAGVPGASIWDPYAQIIVATHMFSNGMSNHWVCK